MQIEPDTLTRLLESWPVGRLATITPAGLPHLLPVVFVADGGRVCMPVDGKRKSSPALARLRNVQAHGHAALLLDHYTEDWTGLWWVRLEGPAWVERDDADLLERVERRLRGKYPQYRYVPPYRGEPTLLMLRWQRVRAWAQGADAFRRAAGAPEEGAGPVSSGS